MSILCPRCKVDVQPPPVGSNEPARCDVCGETLPPPGSPAAPQWHYMRNEEKFGPVPAARLRQLAAEGELRPTDLVLKEGTTHWVPAKQIKGLFPESGETRVEPAPLPVATAVPDAAPFALPSPDRLPGRRRGSGGGRSWGRWGAAVAALALLALGGWAIVNRPRPEGDQRGTDDSGKQLARRHGPGAEDSPSPEVEKEKPRPPAPDKKEETAPPRRVKPEVTLPGGLKEVPVGPAEPLALPAGVPLRPEDFGPLEALIKPRAGEAPWDEIPWIADLHEARVKAAAEGKPLYVWSASGEPLGCT